ncbi:MAG: aspartate aminotransferase family protein [Gemmatimonadetes bacterium]|nr:aspartate aminotransferase family protein [Gemmatimonadota bacterium]MBK6779623.1 aspartate aminotransferase family protein [Gemmatimonadota bacterium]MBK7716400.1 aspartate aminotransferase family protein [Gemmatimonadota bacterium]MBK9069263.1 aspartate aminotransferase family protein [Gemmatimonadota bacterium]
MTATVPSTGQAGLDRLLARAQQVGEEETRRLLEHTPASAALYQRAYRTLPFGVVSSFQKGAPYPVYVTRGKGSHIWDQDGTEYLDFHGGFGAMVAGHAHPRIVEAIHEAASRGTHFAVTTEEGVAFGEEICRRFNLEMLRFANSGTEATMDAIRVARAATGRDSVCKIEGSYHGHHDAVMFSIVPNADVMGGRERPAKAPVSRGLVKDAHRYVEVVPFNDPDHLERLFAEKAGEIACLIMEPAMMNIGIVVPQPGYLQRVRELCTRYGVIFIYDEIKTGFTIAAGGATERFGVQPDLVCLAKAISGGLPAAAFGGRADLMRLIEQGVSQMGTYNGNPLVSHVGLVTLREILTPAAYQHFARLGARLSAGCDAAIRTYEIPGHTVDLGAKGCVSYRPTPMRSYRDFLETRPELFAASYPWLLNRGIFMTPGDEEQWTLSVQHTEADVDRYIEVFGAFCAELRK